MSGGSYNYMCYKSVNEISLGDLLSMRDRLNELGFPLIAEQTNQIIKNIGKINSDIERLSDVWHDVEWLDSGDYSMEQTIEALKKYEK